MITKLKHLHVYSHYLLRMLYFHQVENTALGRKSFLMQDAHCCPISLCVLSTTVCFVLRCFIALAA